MNEVGGGGRRDRDAVADNDRRHYGGSDNSRNSPGSDREANGGLDAKKKLGRLFLWLYRCVLFLTMSVFIYGALEPYINFDNYRSVIGSTEHGLCYDNRGAYLACGLSFGGYIFLFILASFASTPIQRIVLTLLLLVVAKLGGYIAETAR